MAWDAKLNGLAGVVLEPRNPLNTGLRMEEVALARGWALTPEQRKRIVEIAFQLANDGNARWKDRVQAMRVLVAADSLDIRRERNEQDNTHQENTEQIAKLRALLETKDPAIKAMLDQLRQHLTGNSAPPPALPGRKTEGEGALAPPVDPEK